MKKSCPVSCNACLGFKKDKTPYASVTFPVLQYVFKNHPTSIIWFWSYAKEAELLRRKKSHSISQAIEKVYE